ncbi:MAG: ChaN family lipoprotein [Myxococcales bacterium]
MCLAACLIVSFSLAAAPKPAAATAAKPGDLVDVAGKPFAWPTLVEHAKQASIILIGESHLSTCDHRMQRRILDALVEGGIAPAIGMEMIPVDQSAVLKAFNAGRIPPSAMDKALDWGETWGFPFPLYQPLFEAARRYQLPVVALNVPKMAAFLVARHAAQPEDLRPKVFSAVPTIPPSPLQRKELEEEFLAHGGKLSDETDFEHFALVQAMWDTKMAMEALRATQVLQRPVVIIAGAGHVESLGIPYRLQVLAQQLKVLAIQPWRGGPVPGNDADAYFYCPK